jgi:hypothetical protein
MNRTEEPRSPKRRSDPGSDPEAPRVELDIEAANPETIAIEILLEARRRLSAGASPCALENRRWPPGTIEPIRTALDRMLPPA